MLKAKIIRKCPSCRQSLNPRLRIGKISCCSFCGWAGSFHSQNYGDWIQFKVSGILIGITFLAFYGLIQADQMGSGKMMSTIKSAVQIEKPETPSPHIVRAQIK